MKHRSCEKSRAALSWPVLIGLLGVRFLLWAWLGGRYGFHGDELYYIESAEHLDFGYVDHPPMVVWAAALSRTLLGESLHALRLLPMLAGMATITLALFITRELRGGAWAQFVAGLALLLAPVFLVSGNMLTIVVFEPVYWTLAAYLIVLAIKRGQPWLWLAVGIVAGFGLMNKHTMLLWGVGITIGLLVTSERKVLRTPWPWIGGVFALLVLSPNLIWQIQHGWPTLEFIRNMEGGTLAEIPRLLFMLGQVLYLGPFFVPIWIAGLIYFFSAQGRSYRLFGWVFLVAFTVLVTRQGKPYYLAAAYPVLFAGGAVQWERWLSGRPRLRAAAMAFVVGGGLVLAPFAAPMLPLRQAESVIGVLLAGIVPPQAVTGDFRMQVGWPEQLDQLAEMANAERRARRLDDTAILLSNRYSVASAVSVLDGGKQLPPAYSGHMSWFYWGPPPDSAQIVLAHGYKRDKLEQAFDSVTEIGKLVHPMCDGIEYLAPAPIYLCLGPKKPWVELWPTFRRFSHVE